MADDEPSPAAAARFFEEPKREVVERLLQRIKAAYWEACGVPQNEDQPPPKKANAPGT
jgi:hypothetical protein